jgi:hypothetical protein
MALAITLQESVKNKNSLDNFLQLGEQVRQSDRVIRISALEPHCLAYHYLCTDFIESIAEIGLKLDPLNSWYNLWTSAGGLTTKGQRIGMILDQESKIENSHRVAPRPG